MALRRLVFPQQNETIEKLLMSELSIGALVASTLASRGVTSPEQARAFLMSDSEPEDPMLMADMDRAVGRISRAIEAGERIEVFGDYDVDGMTAAAALLEYLESAGAEVSASLPTREGDGYGLNQDAVRRMKDDGVSLIVTVDNGISSHEAIDYASSLGIDTVVTDHHMAPDVLPAAAAVVDPLRADDKSVFKELAGVGVVLKLIAAMEGCTLEDMTDSFGVFAALGTVSDVMPLRGTNRFIVARGVEQLRMSPNIGIAALASAAGIDPVQIDSRAIAFSLAPRLNAAGRMGNAETAFRLLRCEDEDEAVSIAAELEELNAKRQSAEREMMELIDAEIKKDPSLLRKPVLIFANEGFSAGISGIVCSRLAERYTKPTLILALSGDVAKGSGRSAGGFSLYSAIKHAEKLLLRFGGHDMAAGFTMKRDDVEEFKRTIWDYCENVAAPKPFSDLAVSAKIELSEVEAEAVRELSALAPFGSKNEEPVFATCGAEVQDITPLSERHSRITLRKDSRTVAGALFGRTPVSLPFKKGDLVDAAYNLSIYSSPHGDSISVKFRYLRPAGQSDDSLASYADYAAFSLSGTARGTSCAASRDDVAAVYRSLREAPLFADDPEAIGFRFPALSLGKAAAALDVLTELGLARRSDGDGAGVLCVTESPKKRDLSESEIFRSINGAQ